jgi:hypothetical protein
MKRLPNSRSDRAFFPLSQDWERGRVRVGGGELHGGPSFPVITLTPPLSRKPGEGVTWSRPDKGLFGAEKFRMEEAGVRCEYLYVYFRYF